MAREAPKNLASLFLCKRQPYWYPIRSGRPPMYKITISSILAVLTPCAHGCVDGATPSGNSRGIGSAGNATGGSSGRNVTSGAPSVTPTSGRGDLGGTGTGAGSGPNGLGASSDDSSVPAASVADDASHAVSGSADAGAEASPSPASACAAGADPLKTGDARVDEYDCILLDLAAKYVHPDPMMVKAQIQLESGFNALAISPDSPCGVPAGWTDPESKSFGLIQVTPACGEAQSALLLDGHPNMETNMQSPMWATSVFNPSINLDEGFQTIVGSLRTLQGRYPGCTSAQYVEMSAGAFNSGDESVTGCAAFASRPQGYVNAVLGHYHGFAKSAGWPDPY